MLPAEPLVNTDYPLVKVVDGQIACTLFRRYYDGSAGFHANGVYTRAAGYEPEHFGSGVYVGADESPTAWMAPWGELVAFGFVELDEARRTGVVPPDWEPPPQYLATPPRTHAHLVVTGLERPPTVRQVAALRRMFPELADRSVGGLRDRLKDSASWVITGLPKEQCVALRAKGREMGLEVEVMEDPPLGVPTLWLWE